MQSLTSHANKKQIFLGNYNQEMLTNYSQIPCLSRSASAWWQLLQSLGLRGSLFVMVFSNWASFKPLLLEAAHNWSHCSFCFAFITLLFSYMAQCWDWQELPRLTLMLQDVRQKQYTYVFIAEVQRVAESCSSPEMSALLRNRKYICITWTCKEKRTNESSSNTSPTTEQTGQSPSQIYLSSKNCPHNRFLLLSLCFIAYFPHDLLSDGGLLPQSISKVALKGLEKAWL